MSKTPPPKRSRTTDFWVPQNHVHDGNEPRVGNHCKSCRNERKEFRGGKYRSIVCDRHPLCNFWDGVGEGCGWCEIERSVVTSARQTDSLRRRSESTLTKEYYRSNIGSFCYNCGYGPLTPMREVRHPRQLSMNRIDNNKPHSSDPAQTVPSCYQCNVGQSTLTLEEFHNLQISIVNYVNRGFQFTLDQLSASLPQFPNHYVSEGNGKRKFVAAIIKHLRKRAPNNFSLTEEHLKLQFEHQRGMCSLCCLPLGNNITIDQTIAGNGYHYGKVTLMHHVCNSFKGEWDINECYETAKRHVVFWPSRNTDESVAVDHQS